MLKIPLIYIKDKQAFANSNLLKVIGKPIDVAKELYKEGYKLIHIIDVDALKGLSTNMDVYDKMTYFVNIQVECGPNMQLVQKLLSVKARIVLEPSVKINLSELKEKKLLVAKVKSKKDDVSTFHDVILNSNDVGLIEHFDKEGKRIILFEKENEKSIKSKVKIWGKIISFPS